MNLVKNKKTRRALKKMHSGHGLFSIIISLPENGSYTLLIKMNNGEVIPLKLFKDANTLGERKRKIFFQKFLKIT
jgi:hypothetical protein